MELKKLNHENEKYTCVYDKSIGNINYELYDSDIKFCSRCYEYLKSMNLLNFREYHITKYAMILLMFMDGLCPNDTIINYINMVKNNTYTKKCTSKPCCLFHTYNWHVCSNCFNNCIVSNYICCSYSYRLSRYNINNIIYGEIKSGKNSYNSYNDIRKEICKRALKQDILAILKDIDVYDNDVLTIKEKKALHLIDDIYSKKLEDSIEYILNKLNDDIDNII